MGGVIKLTSPIGHSRFAHRAAFPRKRGKLARLSPPRRAIALMAVGAAPALAIAVAAPGMWTAAAAWIVFAVGLMLADLLLAASPRSLELTTAAPRFLGVG